MESAKRRNWKAIVKSVANQQVQKVVLKEAENEEDSGDTLL